MLQKFIKIGLISISDRASSGVYEDKGIPELEAWLKKHYGTAEVLAIVIGCSAALLLLEYQNRMWS